MPSILEPIGAGIIVALINKFIINNQNLWASCKGHIETHVEHNDDVSSTSTSATETVEVHAHF